jgi:hypothetical protein
MNASPTDQTPSTPFGQSYSDDAFEETDRLLAETKPWVRFVSVLGFVMCALPLASLAHTVVAGPRWTGVLAFSFVFTLFFYLIPSLLLWNYGSRIGEYLRGKSPASFSEALAAQKSFWRYLGIVVVTVIVLYVVAIAGFVAFGLSSTMR